MPFVRIWVHLIWLTKNRQKIINERLREELIKHILDNAQQKQNYIEQINCVQDHCHALISLGVSQSISKVVASIKGESSHWINSEKLIRGKFEWQEEYLALSVSESQINRVRDYIRNQVEHHQRRTFNEEYDIFLEKNRFRDLG